MTEIKFSLSDLTDDLPVFHLNHDLLIDVNVHGTWAFVTRDEPLLSKVCSYFGKNTENALIKIWQYPIHTNNLRQIQWGRYFNLLQEPALEIQNRGWLLGSLKLQNFAAFFNLAPRVYALFLIKTFVGSTHLAILTEHPDGLPANGFSAIADIWDEIVNLQENYGFDLPWDDRKTPNNFINGRLIDWQHGAFNEKYAEFLKNFYLKNTQFGDSKYQTAPWIGAAEGIRDSQKRIRDLGLDKIAFLGKTVLDLGCNGGQFLNYALTQGARYGIGIDWPNVIEAARYTSNFLGHFNVEYSVHALHEGLPWERLPKKRFDVVFFLSMVTHVGVPDYLNDLADMMIIEINHAHQLEATLRKLGQNYWLKPMGAASDHGDRQIYWAYHKGAYSNIPSA